MKRTYLNYLIFCLSGVFQLHFEANAQNRTKVDWMLNPSMYKATIQASENKKDISLNNGLVKRTFRLAPNVTCIDFLNLMNGQQLLRSVKPEGRLTINGKDYTIGGLKGQKENAYLLPEWLDQFHPGENDFKFVSYDILPITPQLNWKSKFWAMNTAQATGKRISFHYKPGASELAGLEVTVNYELYDGLPLITKSLTILNHGDKTFKINHVVNEILGMVEEQSAVVGKVDQMAKPQGIYFETNYAFNNAMRYDLSDQTTHWKADPDYTSQVNYDYQTPCLLEIYPDKAPGIDLHKGETFNSVRTYELLMDSYDRERRGLSIRKMYSTIAPWTTANPIFMHLVSRTDEEVRTAIDQCAATGYEALILSFGSHCDMEDTSLSNLNRWKQLADYAHSKKIFIGGYSLFSSRKISDQDDVIDPKTGKPGGAFFGNAPCFGSQWGLAYRDKIKNFYQQTGFDIWENDGPYAGDVCASTTHPGHKGLEDSQWQQINIQKELYHWLNERGVYINAPDWYFLDGTHKIAIGYREVNFSLPRTHQLILNRQNIFDGTWEKTASMSWGFVPLTKYQGGGPEAVLEPLKDHLKDYEQLMVQYYGAGVQACYRGPRLYDTEATRQTVVKVVDWYKKYRNILNSEMIHLRRADGRDWDGILHVNPSLKTRGMLMLYNPLKERITRTIKIPLYYAGLTDLAMVKEQGREAKPYKLNRNYEIEYTCVLAPESYTWVQIEDKK
ncbi:alpha-galactosidase [Pedobacter sp. HMWF019]|uniref:alpha-galactosidase n=1 Tax=Pedobacter sp. HMWF019 TaxID=2056856 RepID=UPI000D345275|nr:alpha-galactosidase [Pedobacter sp. HMWF019]PTT00338.1 alpha-galactosidase [Pedobacter sp. HMWF019]